jgi:drug/metabolite transporter (DMT)-like permease
MWIVALLLISATLFVQHGITMVTATRASVIFLFELVVAAVAAYYLAGEVMEWNEWLGGALIIVASILSANNTHD